MNSLTNRRRATLAVIAALIIAAVACGSPTPAPAGVNPAPTDAPTATDAPTERPTERPTATPDVSEEEDEYARTMYDLLGIFIDDANDIVYLFGLAADNPYALVTDEWTEEVYTTLDSMRATNRRIRALDPPARFEDVHSDLVEASHLIDCAADHYEEGVREIDVDEISRGNDCIDEASVFIDRANRRLDALD